MKHALSSLVALICLLSFTVTSAACLSTATLQQDDASSMHAMVSSDHACCPGHASETQLSSSCCTVHHQPASSDSSDPDRQPFLPLISPIDLALANNTVANNRSGYAATPLRQPPLIPLRI